jgi:hypothetical protein
MHRNGVWLSLLLGVIVLASWFSFKAGYDVFKYAQLSEYAPIKIRRLKIVEQKHQKFVIIVFYSFEFQGRLYEGSGSFGSPYLNLWSAEKAAERVAEDLSVVWFNPKNPDYSTPDKKIPWKTTLSASVLLLMSIYFLWLGFYVTKKRA